MATELPDSITAIGEQLSADRPIELDPQLLSAADVFAAERQRLFLRPWVAVDHRSRIEEPGRFVRFEAGARSALLTRDAEGVLRALRNVCIHAGYPVCDAEEGPAERLVCPYHGWEFAADGRLLEPDLSRRIDPARLRLASHPVRIQDGLIFVDLSRAAAADEIDNPPTNSDALPGWLAEADVIARSRHTIEWNWKLVLQFIKSSPHLFCEEATEDAFVDFGPLSLMLALPQSATLLRIIPKSTGRSEIDVVQMAPQGPSQPPRPDRVTDQLPIAAEAGQAAQMAKLDRAFLGWYWSLMSAD